MIRIAKDLAIPLEAVTETFAILGRRGSGKALALDTPIPTPNGWTTMGALRVGDVVFDERGAPCRVEYTSLPMLGNRCYRVKFSDGNSIVADAEHLWLSETLASRKAEVGLRKTPNRGRGPGRSHCQRQRFPELLTTESMLATLTVPMTISRLSGA